MNRWLLAAALALPGACFGAGVSFERDVQPLLERRCNGCHNAAEQGSGLDLTRLETMLRGGDTLGPAVVAGEPAKSPLIGVLTGACEPKMPETGGPLPDEEIELLSRWIAEGALDDTPTFPADEIAFFEREIRPVLATRCFKCHAGDDAEHALRLTSRQGILAGGDSGPAAVAGDPKVSLLISAIKHDGELKMPKGGDKLSAAEVAAFERWISIGMPWPAHARVLARARQFTISEADRNHWAFRPLPAKIPPAWSIDSTLAAHHERLDIEPAREADRHRLLRRLSYDLIGHPPTAEEIRAFVTDKSPDAYEKVVSRLLASPLFGWRWGRHWLDWTRNGVNQQSNRGPAIDSARYARWVADSFNADRPWDWFARVHVAGDLMPVFDGSAEYSVDQAIAATIPINGQRTFEEVYTDTFRLMDKLDESVEFLGRSLMGMSLECARCHDHKFDPISQRDYYALLGFFQSSWFAPVPLDTSSRSAAEEAVQNYRELLAERSLEEGRFNFASRKRNGTADGRERLKAWQQTRMPEIVSRERRLIEIELAILAAEKAAAVNAKLAADVQTAIDEATSRLASYAPPDVSGRFWGRKFHWIGGHKSEGGLIKRATRAGLPNLVPELDEQLAFWQVERERWTERGRLGGSSPDDPAVAELVAARERIARLDKRLPIPSVVYLFEPPRAGYVHVRCDGGLRRAEELQDLEQDHAEGIHLNSNTPGRAWRLPAYVGDARLLERGDVLAPAGIVPRGVPQFFGGDLGPLEGSGRRQLAEWLTAPNSIQGGLVARTAVNRAWQHLFGEPLCRTPAEMGRLGTPPELPELIDGLSARFVAGGWSLKNLVREIVTSAAYRRSAIVPDAAREADPANRFFARQNVRRLECEPIMNTIAWLRTGERFGAPEERARVLPQREAYAELFDGPTAYQLIERRATSISAAQALFVMNGPQAFRDTARKVQGRLGLGRKAGGNASLDAIYETVLQRPPTAEERKLALDFVARRRARGAANPQAELQDFIGLLLAGNELLFVE